MEPALAFIQAMAPAIATISPHFVASARRLGGSLMRIHRDTRFARDKSPYKINIGIQFRHERGRDVHAPGCYVHIVPGSCFLGAGIWHPDPKALRAIRTEIVEQPALWQRALDDRAFRRHFNCTPAQYRARGTHHLTPAERRAHADVIATAGPCVGLFHLPTDRHRRLSMGMLSIERRDLTAQHILFTRLRAARHELARAIGEGVGKVYTFAQQNGIALTGHPFTRYVSAGPGLLTIEVGFHVSATVPGGSDVEAGQHPGGPAVVAVHGGSYEHLAETYAAAERWMEENAVRPADAPWEWYVTDPADHPDPSDWRTHIFWPIAERS
jgi:effector-binding domain-containing protein